MHRHSSNCSHGHSYSHNDDDSHEEKPHHEHDAEHSHDHGHACSSHSHSHLTAEPNGQELGRLKWVFILTLIYLFYSLENGVPEICLDSDFNEQMYACVDFKLSRWGIKN